MKFTILENDNINKQVERWELFAKLVPPFFLFGSFILLVFDLIQFDKIFYAGLFVFAMSSVTWWFWSLFTVRYILKLMNKTTNTLIETKEELALIRKEVVKLQEDE
mgnify:FL=1|jgi:hypothetical protein